MPPQPRRSSGRANAGQRERADGFIGDSKQILAQLVDVVAMHAVVADCSIADAIKVAGRGYLDRRQHEGRVRRAIEKLKLSGAVDALRLAAAEDIGTATAKAMANNLPAPMKAPQKLKLADMKAPEWADLPGPETGGERYRVSAPSLVLHRCLG